MTDSIPSLRARRAPRSFPRSLGPAVSRSRNPAVLIGLLLAVTTSAFSSGPVPDLRAAEASPPRSEEAPLTYQFRRIFVPADRVGDVTHGNQRFLPVPREEFERLLETTDRVGAEPAAWVEHAEFRAQLQGDDLIQGFAELDVQHAGDTPAWLEIESAGLAPEKTRWADERPLTAGTYYIDGIDNSRRGVVVDAPGAIRFAWTAQGRQSGNSREFRLTLPEATTTDFVLVARPTVKLSASGASIRSTRRNSAGDVEYRLTLRGGEPFILRTLSISQETPAESLALQHRTSYEVTPSEVRIDALLRVLPFDRSTQQFALRCPSSVQIVDIALGGQLLSFSEAPAGAGREEKIITVSHSEAFPPGETELHVRAFLATEIGATMRLPLVQVDRSTWLGGRVEIAVDRALQVHDLRHDGFQPVTSNKAAQVEGVQWVLEQSSPTATLAIDVWRAPKRLRANLLTSVELSHDELAAETVVDLTSQQGAESIFHAEVAPGWQITSVESQPAGMVRSWSPEASEDAHSVLLVLDQPLMPEAPVRLRIKSRLPKRPEGMDLSTRQLAPLHFPHLSAVRHWVELVPAPSLAVSAEGSHLLPTAQAEDLPIELQGLLSNRRDTLLFAADSTSEPTLLATRSRAAEFTADIRLDVQITESTLRHRYRILIEPQSGQLARLGLMFSDALSASPQWRFVDQSGRELAAEQITGEFTDDAAGPDQLRTLRWQLGQSQTEPFELYVTFDRAWDAAAPLLLAAVEASSAQSGTVELYSDRSTWLTVENRSLEPIPLAGNADSESTLERLGAYRFEPERIPSRDGDPLLVVRRVDSKQALPAAWIRTARVRSVYLPSGAVVHDLSLAVESRGLEQLEVQLPAAEGILYRTGGSTWRQVSPGPKGDAIQIPLANDSGRRTLEVRFRETRRPLGSVETIRPLSLSFSIPVGRIDYRAWLPQGFQAVEMPHPAERLLSVFQLLGDAGRTGVASESDDLLVWEAADPPAAQARTTGYDVIQVATIRLWSFAFLIFGGWLGVSMGRARPRLVIAAAALGFAGALFAPAAYAPLASALSWGCLGAAVLRRLLAPIASAVPRWLRVEERDSREVFATSTVLLVGLGMCASGLCVEPHLEAGSSLPILSVFDPIDENREPTGASVFVPESLYTALLHRQKAIQAPLGQWLITRTHVRGSLTQASGSSPVEARSWNVLIELTTFHRNADVWLPLVRDAAQWDVDSIRVDGARTHAAWSNDGNLLFVRIAEPGNHYLELNVQPLVREQGGVGELSLPMLATAECSLELSVPKNMSEINFPNASGEVRHEPSSSTYRGFLGPTEELLVSWPVTRSSRGDATIDVLTWLHMGRAATRIEQRLIIRSVGDEPLHFEVVPPRGVRFLPAAEDLPQARVRTGSQAERIGNSSDNMGPDAQTRGDNGHVGRISVTAHAAEADTVVVPLQFVAEHSATAATVPVPRIAIEGPARVAGRWTAIQPAAGLRLNPLPGMGAEEVDRDTFLSRWGPVEVAPERVYREQPDAADWRIALEGGGLQVEATESILAVAQPTGVTAHYRAECRADQAAVLVHRLRTPADFSISNVAVNQDGRDLGAWWHRTKRGDLHILLPESVKGLYTLSVQGTIAADESGNVVVPVLHLEARAREAARLTVARTPGTVLELERSGLLQARPNASLPAGWQEAWYLYGQYVVSPSTGSTSAVTAKVGRTEPPREARTVLVVLPNLRGWDTRVHCSLSGMQQALDQLVFVASKEWRGPYEVDSPTRWKISVQEDAAYNRVILTPQTSPGEQVRVTLRGQVLQDRQDRLTIPEIRLVEPGAPDTLVALPRRASGQAAVWRTGNLLPVEDPSGLESLIGSAGDWILYRKNLEPATARLSVVEQGTSAPLVSFVEAHARVARDGILLETTLTLDPRGRRNCEVMLQQAYDLLDVRVNGQQALPWRAAPRRWNVQLDSSQLPQLISITCRKSSGGAGDALQLDAPVLLADGVKIPVLQTAWHVTADERWHANDTTASGWTSATSTMLAAVRLANLIESLDEVVPALLGGSAGEWTPWLTYWRERVAAAHDRYTIRAATEPDDAAEQAVQAARQRLAEIEDALAQASLEGAEARGRDTDVRQDVAANGREGPFEVRWLGTGRVDAIRLERQIDQQDLAAQRTLGTVMLAMIIGGTVWLDRRNTRATIWSAAGLSAILLFTLALLVMLSGQIWAMIGTTVILAGWIAFLVSRQAA